MDQRERVRAVLNRLGLHTPEREECVIALLDDVTPSAFRALAETGLKFESGATTQQIFGMIAPRLGKQSIDREARDQIMLPLREIGVLGIAYADTQTRQIEPAYWKPKSPNNVYVVTDDFRALLAVGEEAFDNEFEEWLGSSAERMTRLAAAEGAAAAAHEDERLVPLTIDTYCATALAGYEVVFIDDADARDATEWSDNVERYDLPLDLSSRWPDVVLRNPSTGGFWIVDCVESDGEIDAVRKAEIDAAFKGRGHVIEGYTTAYRTVTRFAQRQRTMDNVALDTYVWVMEIGGAHWLKQPLGDT